MPGHGRVSITVERVGGIFWCPVMGRSAEDYALTCPGCQLLEPQNTLKPKLFINGPTRISQWIPMLAARSSDGIYILCIDPANMPISPPVGVQYKKKNRPS